jgi:excisionase family DNA binding protein
MAMAQSARNQDGSRILSVDDLEHFGFRRSYAYRMLKAGKIPSIRLGRKYLIPRAKFEEWFEAQGQRALDRALGEVR